MPAPQRAGRGPLQFCVATALWGVGEAARSTFPERTTKLTARRCALAEGL
jgi:hypothetical protein